MFTKFAVSSKLRRTSLLFINNVRKKGGIDKPSITELQNKNHEPNGKNKFPTVLNQPRTQENVKKNAENSKLKNKVNSMSNIMSNKKSHSEAIKENQNKNYNQKGGDMIEKREKRQIPECKKITEECSESNMFSTQKKSFDKAENLQISNTLLRHKENSSKEKENSSQTGSFNRNNICNETDIFDPRKALKKEQHSLNCHESGNKHRTFHVNSMETIGDIETEAGKGNHKLLDKNILPSSYFDNAIGDALLTPKKYSKNQSTDEQQNEKPKPPVESTNTPCEEKDTLTECKQKEISKDNNCGSGVTKMNALVLTVKDREVALCQVALPNVLKKDEVSVRVRYAVANIADMAVLEGKIESSLDKVIPGRELSGVVCGTGDNVTHVNAGDHVVISPCQPHALCKFCQDEDYDMCVKEKNGKTFGIDRNGGWAQFTVVPGNLVYKIDNVALKKAVLMPSLAQVMCSMTKMNIKPDTKILILGCGLPGCFLAQLLSLKGHDKVSIWEDNPNRIKIIKSLDIKYPIICQTDFCGKMIDLVFSSGSGTEAMKQALDALTPHGQFILFGSPGKNGCTHQLTMETSRIAEKSLTIRGMSGTPVNPSQIPPDLANKILDPEKLGVPVFPLEDFKEALTHLTTGDINSVVFQITKKKSN